MKIKMLITLGSTESYGDFKADKEYDVSPELEKEFIANKWAAEVGKEAKVKKAEPKLAAPESLPRKPKKE